jgi:uncharacterized membrane protein
MLFPAVFRLFPLGSTTDFLGRRAFLKASLTPSMFPKSLFFGHVKHGSSGLSVSVGKVDR